MNLEEVRKEKGRTNKMKWSKKIMTMKHQRTSIRDLPKNVFAVAIRKTFKPSKGHPIIIK